MEESRNSSIIDNGIDRISNLPEALIHHILSFLDMRCVVQTCVFSKRWRYVWPSVSNLVFRGDAFGKPGVKQLKRFKKFVTNVLMRRNFDDIHKYHLHWGNCNIQTNKIIRKHLDRWLLTGLVCNVQDLSICIEADDCRCDHEIRFPHFLFNSQSLTKLVLDLTHNAESQVILPESMDLPRLKLMSLSSFFVKDGDSINKLISGCPILESLILRDIWIENGYDMNVKIESHGLKHLEINSNIDILVCSHYNIAKIIKLSTPNLESFICKDYMLQEYCLENVPSLVTADIEILKESGYESLEKSHLEISEEEKKRLYPKRMAEFIRGFHNVKELTISSPGFLQSYTIVFYVYLALFWSSFKFPSTATCSIVSILFENLLAYST
ncbi:F-box/LRR-repeat protein At3g59200-like isoform X2 [Papaver somniferum]|uniref:F-box/LRR-repeat protein At3g59200-like isoform X2 n=1 Tax=Papaver somniferum TaxID=3469 RepID=UPI000E6FC63A|nr:F-box/LRR-repeat protein At3g59200-like isoform X2 [Papaver somniferum]